MNNSDFLIRLRNFKSLSFSSKKKVLEELSSFRGVNNDEMKHLFRRAKEKKWGSEGDLEDFVKKTIQEHEGLKKAVEEVAKSVSPVDQMERFPMNREDSARVSNLPKKVLSEVKGSTYGGIDIFNEGANWLGRGVVSGIDNAPEDTGLKWLFLKDVLTTGGKNLAGNQQDSSNTSYYPKAGLEEVKGNFVGPFDRLNDMTSSTLRSTLASISDLPRDVQRLYKHKIGSLSDDKYEQGRELDYKIAKSKSVNRDFNSALGLRGGVKGLVDGIANSTHLLELVFPALGTRRIGTKLLTYLAKNPWKGLGGYAAASGGIGATFTGNPIAGASIGGAIGSGAEIIDDVFASKEGKSNEERFKSYLEQKQLANQSRALDEQRFARESANTGRAKTNFKFRRAMRAAGASALSKKRGVLRW